MATKRKDSEEAIFEVPEGETADDSALVPIVACNETQHLEELGLGRGIDSTDPKMWTNKTPWQLREIHPDCSNIIGNFDGGIKFKYSKFVSSVRTQQSKIQSSLNIPSSKVNIGLDAYYSQQTSSTVTINGTKVQTRTISFRHDFEDLPNSVELKVSKLDSKKTNNFEEGLSALILSKLSELKQQGVLPEKPEIEGLEGASSVEKLNQFMEKIGKGHIECCSHGYAVSAICKQFVTEYGLTHYVSAISLGAMRYTVRTEKKETTKVGAGGEVKVASAGSAGASSDLSTEKVQKTRSTQEIGRFDKHGAVRRNTHDEQVIGFEIQPVNKLIRVARVQIAMRVAIDSYIQGKTDDTFGPFLVSTYVQDEQVFWKVDGSVVIGTTNLAEASLFYCISGTEGQYEQAEFNIVYYGDEKKDRKLIQNVQNPLSRLRPSAPSIQKFVTSEKPTFRKSDKPLRLKYIFDPQRASFALYKRSMKNMGCFQMFSEMSSLQNWLEGDEYFLKQLSHTPFTMGFVIMQRTETDGEVRYNTTMVSRAKPSSDVGLLFRLNPAEMRDKYRTSLKRDRSSGDQPVVEEKCAEEDEREIGELFTC